MMANCRKGVRMNFVCGNIPCCQRSQFNDLFNVNRHKGRKCCHRKHIISLFIDWSLFCYYKSAQYSECEMNPSSLLLCMCGGIKIELLRFQLNQSGHSEYDSEYVDIEGDDEIIQGGMVRSRSLSICRVQFVKGKWKNNLNVYGSLMTVLLSKWLAYWANIYQIIWAMISFIRVPV